MLDVVTATPQPTISSARCVLCWDVETHSTASIKTFGAFKYAAHPSTDVWLFSYAADEAPFRVWRRGDPVPREFIDAAADPNSLIAAHNAGFELAILHHVLGPKHGFPPIPIERWRCTMGMARAAGLPAKLGLLGTALELTHRKNPAGERLMKSMAAPRKPRKGEPPGIYWRDTPANLDKLANYCIADGEATRELYRRLTPLSDSEQSLWVLDHRINARGFRVDEAFARSALKIAQATGPEINAELTEITGGAVDSVNKVAKILAWLHGQGCTLRTLKKEAVEELLEGDLPTPVRRVLELRQGGAQAASKKIISLLARAGDDGRVRGAFTYHGASTGRWSGEGFQPQNLKRPIEKDLESARAAIATGDLEFVKTKYAKPLAVIGDCIRSTIVAAPGHTLIGADFSSIESRVLAWVAGEEWELDSYRRFDATKNSRDEPYCTVACKIFRVPLGTFNKESPERGIGKTCTLAFGYQGGLRAFRNFSDEFTDTEVEEFKVGWRLAHPAVVRFWYGVDDAAIHAVRSRKMVRYGLLLFKVVGGFLQVKLPSGRKLSYPQPRLILDDRNLARVIFKDNGQGRFIDCRGGQGAYGGMWTENFVSAIARDLLVEAMFRLDAAGYAIMMTVHDEIIAEVPEGFSSTQEFARLMTRRPAWAEDLPIAANAWAGPRYLK